MEAIHFPNVGNHLQGNMASEDSHLYQLIFVMETWCVFFEAGTEFLNTMNFMLERVVCLIILLITVKIKSYVCVRSGIAQQSGWLRAGCTMP
jgi:hypothetical protein